MNRKKIRLLDTVALLKDLPKRRLTRGEVGTVVEILGPDTYEVEFCDDDGQTYAQFAVSERNLLVLHHPVPKQPRRLDDIIGSALMRIKAGEGIPHKEFWARFEKRSKQNTVRKGKT